MKTQIAYLSSFCWCCVKIDRKQAVEFYIYTCVPVIHDTYIHTLFQWSELYKKTGDLNPLAYDSSTLSRHWTLKYAVSLCRLFLENVYRVMEFWICGLEYYGRTDTCLFHCLFCRWAVHLSSHVSSSRKLSCGLIFFNGCFTYHATV